MTTTLYQQKQSQQKQNYKIKHANKMFDYIAILDRLMKVSWSNYSHPTHVIYRITGPTFPLPATALQSKGHIFKFL